MDILTLIKKDHDDVMTLINDIQDGDDDVALVRDLLVEVLLHAKVEQLALYKPIADMGGELREFVMEGKIEHKLVEVVLKKLARHEQGDEEFKASLTVAKELLEHHAREEEEGELFPKLEKMLETAQLAAMGHHFADLKKDYRPRIEAQVDETILSLRALGDTPTELPAH